MIKIDLDGCDRCLECLAVCPEDVLLFKEEENTIEVKADCCMCIACIYVCPHNALSELSE